MAILRMSKFSLIIFSHDKKEILSAMQNFKEVDFRQTKIEDYGYSNFVSENQEDIDDNIYKLDLTIKKLRKYAKAKGAIQSLKEGNKEFTYEDLFTFAKNSNYKEIIEKVNNCFTEYDSNIKTIENAKNKIVEYKPYSKLDISLSNVKSLKQAFITIGTLPTKNYESMLDDLKEYDVYIEILNETNKEKTLAMMFLEKQEKEILEIARKYGYNRSNISIDKKPLEYIHKYEDDIRDAKTQNEIIEVTLSELAKDIETLEVCYEYFKNEKLKETVSETFGQTQNLSVITGYVPDIKLKEFEKVIKNVCTNYYYLKTEEAANDDGDVPIKFKNNGFSDAFEGLVKTYSMPRYSEIDPTPVVAPFYWLFFGMMVADVGYGVLMAILTGLVLATCKLSESLKKNVKFFFYLSFSIMIWGAIYGSYFSLPINVPHIIDPAKDYNTILAMSIVIGVIHIFVALGVKAYVYIKNGKILDAVYDVLFWYILLSTVIIMIGGNSLGVPETFVTISKYLMILSMIGIVLTGGREVKNAGGRIGLGVYALYGISGYIGDFISYARLMALGLSGGFIAQSVNQICTMIGFKLLTIIFTILIFIVGQTFNMLLALLGAYVHSARLIYVEFFGKFYEGGGKEFKDFKIEEKYINIKEKNN
ncbi:V-type ATP synthase subunit I [Caviibacter abscessus]|uniref:V-type ATP synthase subunit I n=1 Tax=Caviibacter abscessus TaxID=1766719 RepID=UPI0008314D78|nr:V-type ATP synthase subunit I [Caviibacter abscessus]